MISQLKKRGNRVVGFKETTKAVKNGRAKAVFLAEDADPPLQEEIKKICRQKDVKLEMVERKTYLGDACGIDVGSSTAALIKEN